MSESDIRGGVGVAPDIAALVLATCCLPGSSVAASAAYRQECVRPS